MKKLIVLISALAIVFLFSACGKQTITSVIEAEAANSKNTANTVSQTVQDDTEATSGITENNVDTQTVQNTSEAVSSMNKENSANTTHSTTASSPESNTLIEEHPPERVDGCILVQHNGEKAWLSNADSEYIKSVISKFETTECALFYGNKEYILHISGTAFGGDVVYYDSSDGVIGNSSTGHISNEEQVKFNDMLSGCFS